MPDTVKTKYMDRATKGFTEYFCIDDFAREKIKPIPGDRAVMRTGEIYFCWEPGIWALIDNNKEPGYKLPAATKEMLGGIKVGENLSITPDGVLSAKAGSSGGGEQWELITPIGETLDEKGRVVLTEATATPQRVFLFDKPYKKIKILMETRGTDATGKSIISWILNLKSFPPEQTEPFYQLGGDNITLGIHDNFTNITIEPFANGRCYSLTTEIYDMGDSTSSIIFQGNQGKNYLAGSYDKELLRTYDSSTTPAFTLIDLDEGITSFAYGVLGTSTGYAVGSKFTFMGVAK